MHVAQRSGRIAAPGRALIRPASAVGIHEVHYAMVVIPAR